jgi:hypothetical protein
MAPKRPFAAGANDDEAGSSRQITPARRASYHHGGLYIHNACQVAAAVAQSAPVTKPDEDDEAELRAALAASLEVHELEEASKWPQLAKVLRTSALEEAIRKAIEDAEPWAFLD